ncbi:phytoene desaturase family protein [Mycolicibacterium sp. CBM1]
MSAVSDVVVVGGGHNGLIVALRLARAGRRVTVVEQGAEPGGCVWTERHPSGVLVERGAFEHGGVYPVAVELGLDDPALGDRALRYREHLVLAGVAFGDGQRRVFYTDVAATVAALGDDGPAYQRLVELSDALFRLLDTFDSAPTLTHVAAALAALPGGDELFRTLLQSAETVLEAAVADPHTRAAMALQAAHAQVPAWAPGSGLFALLLPAAHRGAAVRPAGGSRALVDALVAALERAGATVRTGAAAVALASDGNCCGRVELADGTILTADAVVSAIGLPRTAALLTDPAPAMRAIARGLHSGHFNIAELTVTVVHDRALTLPLEDPDAVWYALATPQDVRSGFADVLAGRLPSSPWSMVGQVRQPEGVTGSAVWMSSIVPLHRADGPWTPEREREAADRVIDQVGSVLGVDLRVGLVDVVVSGPLTWAARIGGDGNPNHLDNTLDQLLGWRPPGHADMRTELPWLFLTGAGQHPGGGLSGVSGSAAAAAVLGTRRRDRLDGVAREARTLWSGLKAYRAMRKGPR